PGFRALPGLTQLHIPGHRVVITPSQLRRSAVTAREGIRLENLHDLPALLHRRILINRHPNVITGEIPGRQRGDRWPPPGCNWPPIGTFNWRRSPPDVSPSHLGLGWFSLGVPESGADVTADTSAVD